MAQPIYVVLTRIVPRTKLCNQLSVIGSTKRSLGVIEGRANSPGKLVEERLGLYASFELTLLLFC